MCVAVLSGNRVIGVRVGRKKCEGLEQTGWGYGEMIELVLVIEPQNEPKNEINAIKRKGK